VEGTPSGDGCRLLGGAEHSLELVELRREPRPGPGEQHARVELRVHPDKVVVHENDARLRLGARELPRATAALAQGSAGLWVPSCPAGGGGRQRHAAPARSGSPKSYTAGEREQTLPQFPSSMMYRRSVTCPAATLRRSLSVASAARGKRTIPTFTCNGQRNERSSEHADQDHVRCETRAR